MLIVVAIIAILIAISIPMVNNALAAARHNTDAANERAAKAMVMLAELNQDKIGTVAGGSPAAFAKKKTYAYDAKNGKLVTDIPSKYGKHVPTSGNTHVDNYLIVAMKDDGTVLMQWTDGASIPDFDTTPPSNSGLCSALEVGAAH